MSNLITGRRHPGIIMRKQLQCKCGCHGYCTWQRLFECARFCIDALARGRHPDCDVDGRPFSNPDRLRLAGQPLGFRAAVTQIMTDWEAVRDYLHVPNWNHLTAPCPLCDATSGSMH
eukprot:713081-Pyramimonas_sp.AAC.1